MWTLSIHDGCYSRNVSCVPFYLYLDVIDLTYLSNEDNHLFIFRYNVIELTYLFNEDNQYIHRIAYGRV